MKNDQPVLGIFEYVSFPLYDDHQVIAKIDTGAYTGALHCSYIKEIKEGKERKIVFRPFDIDTEVTSDEYVVNYVKSSNGSREKRYFVETNISILGKEYPIMLSLTNRSEMKWPVLIGRRFLKRNGFIIDPSKNNEYFEEENILL